MATPTGMPAFFSHSSGLSFGPVLWPCLRPVLRACPFPHLLYSLPINIPLLKEVEPLAAKNSNNTAEGFVGSIFKYSISTFVNMGILGVAILLTGLFIPKEVKGQISMFVGYSQIIMTILVLGLDQSLIRFFYEPPGGLKSNGLFRVCFYLSSAILLGGGALCSVLLARPIYQAIGFSMVGIWVVPLLFLNAFFYMVARYFNVLYRMEGNILLYTVQSILMQFFFKLFYLAGALFGFDNPVPAMVLCSVIGLGAFALVFTFMRRRILRPVRAEFKSGAYKALLPYGVAIAPTAILVMLNGQIPVSYITHTLSKGPAGIYSYAFELSNIVTMIQGGFSSFWGPYMFANYKTQQPRIKQVHDYLNLAVLCFFALLIAFEDLIFFILREFAEAQPIFPVMMLSAVFAILCETTVYGNAIARRPIFDTIGIGLAFAANIGFCVLLVPPFGLLGAAVALALANLVMFLFRTITAQRLYSSINNPYKTAVALVAAVALAAAGTYFTDRFLYKLAACVVALLFYCLLYRKELIHLIKTGLSMVKSLFSR